MNNVLKRITQIANLINNIARRLSQITVAVMVITVIIQVVMRYFFKKPLAWGDELARYSLVYMTFIGASVALRDKQLAAMELIVDRMSYLVKNIFIILVYLIEIVILIFLFYYSIILIREGSVQSQLSPALQVPMALIYFSLPLGTGLMLLQALILLFDNLGNINIKKQGGKK
jgi:TRAP-type C4-dicarboxylate transport system permease small subunit